MLDHSLKGILIPIPSSGNREGYVDHLSEGSILTRSGCNIAWYQSCQHTSHLMSKDITVNVVKGISMKKGTTCWGLSWRSRHLQFDHWFAPVGLEALTIDSEHWKKSNWTSYLLNFDNDLAVMLLNSWHFLVHPLFPSCRSVRPLSCDNVHRAAATYLR